MEGSHENTCHCFYLRIQVREKTDDTNATNVWEHQPMKIQAAENEWRGKTT
jgi:cytochrome bd-type quinol oxidase subunit 1